MFHISSVINGMIGCSSLRLFSSTLYRIICVFFSFMRLGLKKDSYSRTFLNKFTPRAPKAPRAKGAKKKAPVRLEKVLRGTGKTI